MTERHIHDWQRAGKRDFICGGVRERCRTCGRTRRRAIVRCPDCREARVAAKVFSAQAYPCETCEGRGWVDAPKPDRHELCCCYRYEHAVDRCANCRYKAHGMETHNCDVLAAEADEAYRARQADALLDPPAPVRTCSPEAAARARDIGW